MHFSLERRFYYNSEWMDLFFENLIYLSFLEVIYLTVEHN